MSRVPERLAFVKQEIHQLLESGIVVPSSSPYASPIHIIPKQKPGDFWMVGDYRALNNVTQPYCYPLPYLVDFVDIAQSCIIFFKSRVGLIFVLRMWMMYCCLLKDFKHPCNSVFIFCVCLFICLLVMLCVRLLSCAILV